MLAGMLKEGGGSMNKLYSIHFYIKGVYYCEISTFHKSEHEADLQQYPGAKMIENNEINLIYRVDIL